MHLCALKIQSESEEIKPGDIDYRYEPIVLYVYSMLMYSFDTIFVYYAKKMSVALFNQ